MKPKKCPNCGNERIWGVSSYPITKPSRLLRKAGLWTYYMECAKCHWCSGNSISKTGAIIRWNLQKYNPKHY